jgi:hypothetical protein
MKRNRTLYDDTGIDLENICYYKDDTHYFVMTAKKASLLARGVLYSDHTDTNALLHPDNINRKELLNYARHAAKWTTGLDNPFALNHYGEPDVAMFDFTSMYAAENACRAKKVASHSDCCSCSSDCDSNNDLNFSTSNTHKKWKHKSGVNDPSTVMMNKSCSDRDSESTLNGNDSDENSLSSFLLVGLVGDSLLEPFWPTGSGCGRGFLSAMDSAWMVRQWALKGCTKPDFMMDGMEDEECMSPDDVILSVLKEREAIYRLLNQTKSENLSQNYAAYTLNPTTRYPNLNSSQTMLQPTNQYLHLLYDDIAPPPASTAESRQLNRKDSLQAKRLRRATIASSSPFSGLNIENVIEEKISKDTTIIETDENAEVDDIKPRGMDFLVSSMSSSRRRQKKEGSPSYVPVSQVREDVSTINQAFEDSLADFESSYQTGVTASPDYKSLELNTSSSSINNGNGYQSLKDPLDKCRSSAFNDLTMSPSASNLATLGRSRAKDIESALRHRRQQQLAFVRTDNRPSSLSENLPYYKENNRSVNCGNIDEIRSKMSKYLEHQGSDNEIYRDESILRREVPSLDKPVSFSHRVRHLESMLNSSSGLTNQNSGVNTPPSDGYFEDLSDQKKEIRSRGSHVMAAASNLEHLLNPLNQEEKLKAKAKDYHKKTTDIKVVMKMTPQTDWNKKCWEEREKKAQGTYWEFQPPTKRVTPNIKYLIQKLSRNNYCDYDLSFAVDEDTCSVVTRGNYLELMKGHRAKRYHYTSKNLVMRGSKAESESKCYSEKSEIQIQKGNQELFSDRSTTTYLKDLSQRCLSCMMSVLKSLLLILLLLSFFCSFCYFSYHYSIIDHDDLFDYQDY